MGRWCSQKFMKVLIFVILLLNVARVDCSWQEKSKRANFSNETLLRISSVFEKASNSNIPSQILESKLLEGIKKSCDEKIIASALEKKLASLLKADEIISFFTSRGATVRSRPYCLNVASDLLEKNVNRTDIEELLQHSIASGYDLDSALRSVEIYHDYLSSEFPEGELKYIFIVMLAKKTPPQRIEKIFRIALDALRENIKWSDVKESVLENIHSKRNPELMRESFRKHTRQVPTNRVQRRDEKIPSDIPLIHKPKR